MTMTPEQVNAVATTLTTTSQYDDCARAFALLAGAVTVAEGNPRLRHAYRPAFLRIRLVRGTWSNAPAGLMDRLAAVIVQ
jgi:hypothetical protein